LSLALWILCSSVLATQFLLNGPPAGPRSVFEHSLGATPVGIKGWR
jgi:hypothetical protein